MKKILLFLFMATCLIAVNQKVSAQVQQPKALSQAMRTLDTLTNVETSTSNVFTVTGSKSTLSFQVHLIKISGTMAGTINVLASVDGTNYYVLGTASVTDGTKSYGFNFAYNPAQKYKVEVVASGVSSYSAQPWILYRN